MMVLAISVIILLHNTCKKGFNKMRLHLARNLFHIYVFCIIKAYLIHHSRQGLVLSVAKKTVVTMYNTKREAFE